MPIEVDAYIDPATGDLPAVTRIITGIELVQQRIRRRLQRGIGEWFLDPANVGLPLLVWKQQKPPQVLQILAQVQQEIRSVPGVVATQNFSGDHDAAAHRLTITGEVVVDDGSVTAAVITAATPTGQRNSMAFEVFFSSNSIQGALPRPFTGRP